MLFSNLFKQCTLAIERTAYLLLALIKTENLAIEIQSFLYLPLDTEDGSNFVV